MFNIPVVVFLFKRVEKTITIIDRLALIAPEKLYLIADGARNADEEEVVRKCRETVEQHITWPCAVIKNYASKNRGVFENIAGGAKWVFEREEVAIFLEDDNFPSLSFFPFCQEMLVRYKNDNRILWICGTNYLIKSKFKNNASYSFTQNMLPCGWASWANKFNKYYKADFEGWAEKGTKTRIKKMCYSNTLKKQEISNWEYEIYRKSKGLKYLSWDYQMSYTLRSQNLLGIIPKYNQIKNIGVDKDSIHGGDSISDEMTSRFCENEIEEIEFPLIHPEEVAVDQKFEEALGKIITYPLSQRLKNKVISSLKVILKINKYDSLSAKLRSMFRL